MWFRDSLEGDQILGLCVSAPCPQWEMGGAGGGSTGSFLCLQFF